VGDGEAFDAAKRGAPFAIDDGLIEAAAEGGVGFGENRRIEILAGGDVSGSAVVGHGFWAFPAGQGKKQSVE
jgi:hypothetical protein